MDFYRCSIEEIEDFLDIRKIESFHLDKPCVTFDTWDAVYQKLLELRQLKRDPSLVVSIYGYDFYFDNHYINLYYTIRYSN